MQSKILNLLRTFAWIVSASLLIAATDPTTAPVTPTTPETWHPVPGQRAGFGVLLSPGVAPCVVHVNGLRYPLVTGTPLTTRYDWDFGDPDSRYNLLTGFNAAHVYDRPGTYTIKLNVIEEDATTQLATATVVIEANRRHTIFVAQEGSDLNVGTSPEAPLHSLGKACKILTGSCQILLKAGGQYDENGALSINHSDVLIGKYGDGADPVIMLSRQGGPKPPSGTFAIDRRDNGVMFEHLTFDSPYGVADDQPAPRVGIDAINARGRNITVRDCTFLNVDAAINANGSPMGLLVEKCNVPLKTGLRAYLIWGQGSDLVCIGNFAANSTREHIVRLFSQERSLIFDNNFTNLNRQSVDKDDFSKGTIEMQGKCNYGYIAHNIIADGTIRTGPLGLHEDASSATDWAVIEGNQLTNTYIVAVSGAHHIMIRNNLIRNDHDHAIDLKAPDNSGHINADIFVLNNTAIDQGDSGSFINVEGHVDGVELQNNLFVAPNLRHAAAVNIAETDLSSFTKIGHNAWPTLGGANGTLATIGKKPVLSSDWIAMAPVNGDINADVNLDDKARPIGDIIRGEPSPAVLYDMDGTRRSGHPTVGALETGHNK